MDSVVNAVSAARGSDMIDVHVESTAGATGSRASSSCGAVSPASRTHERTRRAASALAHWEWPEEAITWGEELGAGSFACVYAVRVCGVPLAAKSLHLSRVPQIEREAVAGTMLREFRALHKVSHPNIVQLFGVSGGGQTLLMELADRGSLRQLLSQEPSIVVGHPRVQNSLAHDVASGLAHLHDEHNMLHHDVKSANVLLVQVEARLVAKLADFGLASGVAGESTLALTMSTRMNPAAGTPVYRAPETYDNRYDRRSEVYSFAIVLYEIITGAKPWLDQRSALGQQLSEAAIVGALLQGKRPEVKADSVLNAPLAQLMRQCWAAEPSATSKRRPTFARIVATIARWLPPELADASHLVESMCALQQRCARGAPRLASKLASSSHSPTPTHHPRLDSRVARPQRRGGERGGARERRRPDKRDRLGARGRLAPPPDDGREGV